MLCETTGAMTTTVIGKPALTKSKSEMYTQLVAKTAHMNPKSAQSQLQNDKICGDICKKTRTHKKRGQLRVWTENANANSRAVNVCEHSSDEHAALIPSCLQNHKIWITMSCNTQMRQTTMVLSVPLRVVKLTVQTTQNHKHKSRRLRK